MKLFLRVTTALLFIAGIIWLIVDPGFDALTAFLTGILTLIGSFVVDRKPDTETLDQRNRRILLGHVENAWIKGVLDPSLHGAALLDLGIKPDLEAVSKYPWAIKKESTDETLPAGTSMLEIFDSIGMGRSLLVLGAPGSGKTTILLELARQLIEHAREDVIAPIPMVFNLASWTEKLTLADWLAQELSNLYSVPRKTAPDWVLGNKLLLLLDGLDEVRQESRAKCVEAINAFRKAHGLTSLAVCSRSQDYTDLNTKLSFEGAIEVQPLTQEQITEFFNRFGKEMEGIKQALEKDSALREMAETPLFLSIMIMAYRGKTDTDILISQESISDQNIHPFLLKIKYSQDIKKQRKHLFDTYIERMFARPRSKNPLFKKQNVLRWISWLASKMIQHGQVPYFLEQMQPTWLDNRKQIVLFKLTLIMTCGLMFYLIFELGGLTIIGMGKWLFFYFASGIIYGFLLGFEKISTIDLLEFKLKDGGKGLILGSIIGLIIGLVFSISSGLIIGLVTTWVLVPVFGLARYHKVNQGTYPGQKLLFSAKNSFIVWLSVSLFFALIISLFFFLGQKKLALLNPFLLFILIPLSAGFPLSIIYGGKALIQHYNLRIILRITNNLLPWRLVPFLNHCVDLIFLRRVGGGYIFVHRLLMEHFAEMYVETPTSKGNQK